MIKYTFGVNSLMKNVTLSGPKGTEREGREASRDESRKCCSSFKLNFPQGFSMLESSLTNCPDIVILETEFRGPLSYFNPKRWLEEERVMPPLERSKNWKARVLRSI